MIEANNVQLKTWVTIPEGSDFPIQNLPFGIFRSGPHTAVGVAIGNQLIDLSKLYEWGYMDSLNISENVFLADVLNPMISLGKKKTTEIRNRVSELLRSDNNALQLNEIHMSQCLLDQNEVEMLLPVQIGDYTDFYSSIEHATNVGIMFRGPENALMPNWKHIPVGYHGRASSIIVSGEPIRRPKGQTKADDQEMPTFGASRLLDFELETGFITFQGKPLGESIGVNEADEYIFGKVLLNDWSARDIQKWEYVPLGPFLGKNFASHISPWVVTLDALEAFRVDGPVQDPKVLPYLEYTGTKNIDINLEVLIQPENGQESSISKSNYKYMYWNMNQQLAHHSVNGCNINAGDMMGSGTISGKSPDSYGSMLELSWKGTKPVALNDGTERKFIQDHDTVIMRGYCEKEGVRIGFGEVKAKVLPAL